MEFKYERPTLGSPKKYPVPLGKKGHQHNKSAALAQQSLIMANRTVLQSEDCFNILS